MEQGHWLELRPLKLEGFSTERLGGVYMTLLKGLKIWTAAVDIIYVPYGMWTWTMFENMFEISKIVAYLKRKSPNCNFYFELYK